MLTFRTPEVGVSEATVGRIVLGVALSTTPVLIDRGLDELSGVLEQHAGHDEAARSALEQALLH